MHTSADVTQRAKFESTKDDSETDDEYLSRVIQVDGELYDLVDKSYEIRYVYITFKERCTGL